MFFLATLAMTACENGVCIDACDFYEATAGCRNGTGCDSVQNLNVQNLSDGFACNSTKYPFEGANLNLNLFSWKDQLPVDLSFLFKEYQGVKILGISRWNTGNVNNMAEMFSDTPYFQTVADYPGENSLFWDTGNVEDMSYMFFNAYKFNLDIGAWNTAKVETMAYMFAGAADFNQDISVWTVDNVLEMTGMFLNAVNFDQDLTCWNVGESGATNIDTMFQNSGFSQSNLTHWNVSSSADAFKDINFQNECKPGGTGCNTQSCPCYQNACTDACDFYRATRRCRTLGAATTSKT